MLAMESREDGGVPWSRERTPESGAPRARMRRGLLISIAYVTLGRGAFLLVT